jgi:hypothetical protein
MVDADGRQPGFLGTLRPIRKREVFGHQHDATCQKKVSLRRLLRIRERQSKTQAAEQDIPAVDDHASSVVA